MLSSCFLKDVIQHFGKFPFLLWPRWEDWYHSCLCIKTLGSQQLITNPHCIICFLNLVQKVMCHNSKFWFYRGVSIWGCQAASGNPRKSLGPEAKQSHHLIPCKSATTRGFLLGFFFYYLWTEFSYFPISCLYVKLRLTHYQIHTHTHTKLTTCHFGV